MASRRWASAGRVLAVCAGLWSGATCAQSFAQSLVPSQDISIAACTESSAAVEAADSAFVNAVAQRFSQQGLSAVRGDVPRVEEILRRHAGRHRIEACSDRVVVNSGDTADGLLALLAVSAGQVGAATKDSHLQANVDVRKSYLALAAALAGFAAAEDGDFAHALSWLEQGLQLAPHDPSLVAEAANALSRLGRHQEALSRADDMLAYQSDQPELRRWRPVLLRRRGLALAELGRLDDAQKAYQEALALAPGDPVAANELAYIARLKAGAVKSDITQTTVQVAPKP